MLARFLQVNTSYVRLLRLYEIHLNSFEALNNFHETHVDEIRATTNFTAILNFRDYFPDTLKVFSNFER